MTPVRNQNRRLSVASNSENSLRKISITWRPHGLQPQYLAWPE
jgi:hypothetical protein